MSHYIYNILKIILCIIINIIFNMQNIMFVKKRDGREEKVSFDKITRRIEALCTNIKPNLKNINPYFIAQKVISRIYNGVTTTEIDDLTAELCTSEMTSETEYGDLASRIVISNNHKNTNDSFISVIEKMYSHVDEDNITNSRISDDVYNFIIDNKDIIVNTIDYERDFNFDYFGFKTLEKAYLVKLNGSVVERIQHMLMRVSLGIWCGDIDSALNTYNMMSNKYFIHATPTLFHAGSKNQQMLSCFLLGLDDSIKGIYKTLYDCAQISKWAGGIGAHITNIRAKNSIIRGTNGVTSGVIPMLKVYNETARYVNQSGKRNGSFAIYIEPWHADIISFLNLRKNHGDENQRARDLFYAMWIPDLFMKRLNAKGKWSLFCPDECKGLCDLYGDKFEKQYEEYEKLGKARATIDAEELWKEIIISQIETGTPYILYKDHCNNKSNQMNLGTIKSSNLCTEIIEYSDSKEYACCTLGSIGLPAFIKYVDDKPVFDFVKLSEVSKTMTRNLNRVIDLNYYPVPETELSNKKHRPLGIGVQGLADVYCVMRYSFDSKEAYELNRQIFATIYYSALTASLELSVKHREKLKTIMKFNNQIESDVHDLEISRPDDIKGAYSSFQGSPISMGMFQFDLWGKEPEKEVPGIVFDWERLRDNIIKNGIRNSLLMAPMPTASTSQILGNNECIEPYTSNIYSRRVLAGDFEVVNKYLIKDLQKLNIWSRELKDKIVMNRGSVQGINEIPKEIQNIYKTTWDLSQKVIIEQSAERGIYVCQSQSLNLWMAKPEINKISSMHKYSWKMGLKTGMYYLRTRAAASAQQFTIDPTKQKPNNNQQEESCEFCSA